MNFTFVDLFCGIGGFHTAMIKQGGKCVFACDSDKECQKVYQANYGILPFGDITKVHVHDIPDHDVLCAGFPCQPFSNAGKRLSRNGDSRGMLFDEIIRIASTKKPRIMFLENVKHIKKIDEGRVYQYIYTELERIGYDVCDNVFSPHVFGIPQLRERIIFVCTLKDDLMKDKIYGFISTTPTQIEPNLSLIIKETDIVDEKYKVSDELSYVFNAWNEMLKLYSGQKISFPIYIEYFNAPVDASYPKWKQEYIRKNNKLYNDNKIAWDTWYSKHENILNKKKIYKILEYQAGTIGVDESLWNHFIQIRQSGIRVKRGNYFPTLVAIVQTPIVGFCKRYLTPRECARLQSFPESFQLHENDQKTYKQMGNSVNVNVIEYVSSRVFQLYKSFHDTVDG